MIRSQDQLETWSFSTKVECLCQIIPLPTLIYPAAIMGIVHCHPVSIKHTHTYSSFSRVIPFLLYSIPRFGMTVDYRTVFSFIHNKHHIYKDKKKKIIIINPRNSVAKAPSPLFLFQSASCRGKRAQIRTIIKAQRGFFSTLTNTHTQKK